MNDIITNAFKIGNLLKVKDGAYAQIQARMAVRSSLQANMSGEQMDTFRKFCAFYADNGKTLKSAIEDISERMSHAGDNVHELAQLRSRQKAAIIAINSVIDECEQTLEVI